MTPRASFVIPAYNAQCWISKAVLSCLNQSVRQIEVIVVDDGSTDATRHIVNHHASKDKRLKCFHFTDNMGRSAARNFGNSKAESDIIMVLDADDMAMRDRAKNTLAFFKERNPDVAWGSFFVIDAFGNIGHKIGCQEFKPQISRETRLNYICHSTMAYRKGVTLNIPYDTGEYSKLGLDDWKFQWDCFHKGYSMKHIKTPLSYYRQLKGGTVGTRDEKLVTEAKERYLSVSV